MKSIPEGFVSVYTLMAVFMSFYGWQRKNILAEEIHTALQRSGYSKCLKKEAFS